MLPLEVGEDELLFPILAVDFAEGWGVVFHNSPAWRWFEGGEGVGPPQEGGGTPCLMGSFVPREGAAPPCSAGKSPEEEYQVRHPTSAAG
jgi:hypothetical protein